ncbi:MAG: magnesium transporter CorA family protein [Muribaculaceae bacterium]|nr:magnesium transporter CorA family protein [Muribaculaceae bacterium]
MRVYRFNDGLIEPSTSGHSEANALICIEEPDDSDYAVMSQRYGIPDNFIESAADFDERPRLECDHNWRMTILRVPVPDNNGGVPYRTVPIGIITDGDTIFTLCYQHTNLMEDFIDHSHKRCNRVSCYPDLLLRLLCSTTYWFQRYLKTMYNDVMILEKGLEKSIRNEELIRLMRLQQSLVYFNTAIKGNEAVVARIEHLYADSFDPDLAEDAQIEITQADNTVNIYMEILAGTMDAFASIISNNVNGIMKRMTAISIVLMVPTLVASFYGMNVDISLAGHSPSFWVIVLASLILTFGIFTLLKKASWL